MTRAARFSSTNGVTDSSAARRLKKLAQASILSIALGALFAEVPGHATTVAQDPLPYSKGYLVTGNYVVAGVDLPKANASGAITISGVPDNADIISAYLYWETTSSVDIAPVLSAVTFRGNPLYGTDTNGQPMPLVPIRAVPKTQTQLPGNGASCWGSATGSSASLTMFRADVIRFLPKQLDKNNEWTGKRLANGTHTITLPQTGTGNVLTQSAGATLFIVYRDPEPNRALNPLRKIVVYDGVYANPQGETMSQTIKGFYKSATSKSAKITQIVGSGSVNMTDALTFTGAGSSLVVTDPFPPPLYSSADRGWANPTYDVSAQMPGTGLGGPYGETVSVSVAHTNSAPYECLAWSAVIFSTVVADVDHDGLPDGLEDDAVGLKDPDGKDLPKLKAMGAGSDKPDIFVEINAMWAAPGTTYGSADAPINPPNEIVRTDSVGHRHNPAPQDLKLVGDAYLAHGIRPHFDVGDVTSYHSLGVVQHSTWVDDYTSTIADGYLVPSNFARGGEVIQERACDPSGPFCLFPAYPGTVLWKLGMQFERDAPVGDNGEELTDAGLTAWLSSPTQRQRFDPERRGLFHYVLFAHTRGKPRSPFPCLDANSQPTGFGEGNTCSVSVNKDHHVPSSASGIADLGGNVTVTLGMWDEFVGTPFIRASTLFHELGHNLGLFHGGLPPIWGDKTKNPATATYIEPNCKPNYISSMSYLFQAHGLMDDSGELHLDYSGTALSNIDENLLSDGPLGPPSYVPVWFAPFSSPLATLQAAPQATRFCNGAKFDPASPPSPAMARVEAALSTDSIDWDGGSNLLGPQNVNFDGTASGASVITSPLFGFNDWANIRLDQIGDLPDTKRNADGLGELADIFGGNLAAVFGGDARDIFGGDAADVLSGDAADILSGDAGDVLSGDAKDVLGGDAADVLSGDAGDVLSGDAADVLSGGELTVEHARGLGASRPHAFRACVIGTPGCAPGTPFTPTYHRVQTSWKAPTFGHVVGYHVYRVTGGAVTATNLAAKVEVQGSPTTATTLTLIDPEELPNNVQFTYFATAEFDDETPHKFSGASNLITITAVNESPVAVANSYSCVQALNVPAPGVLGNDTDVDSPVTVARPQPLTAVLVTPPATGVLTLNANGGFTYTRSSGSGASFTYKANNGKWSRDPSVSMNAQDSNTVTVTIATNGNCK